MKQSVGTRKDSTGNLHIQTNSLVLEGLTKARKNLLDLSARNRLLNFKHSGAKILRLIDEVPDQIYQRLVLDAGDDPKSRFLLTPVPLPKKADYPTEKKEIAESPAEFQLKSISLEKKPLSLEKRTHDEIDLSKIDVRSHAKKLGLSVDYQLPRQAEDGQDKHQDNKLQTLLYPEPLDKVVRRIQSEARTAIEESGVNMLFLCLGFLKWSDAETSDVFYHAPLIIIPIALEREKVDTKTGYAKFYVKYTGEDIFDNICLREKLGQFAIDLPSFEDFELPEKYFTEIEALLKDIKPKWTIDRFATIGFLSFGKMLMYLDLDPARWPADASIADAAHIADIFEGSYADYGAMAEEFDIDGDETLPRLPLVLDADSSQHSAIIDVLNGKNIVIEGPPGTGKSQTITNLIAACLANGKSVLFVAEKLTALEVVRRRLDSVELGAFCLELHSHKTQKKTLLADIKKRLEINTDAYRHTLKDLENRLQDLNSKKAKLIEYANAINMPFAGVEETPHQILWKTEHLRRSLVSTVPPENFPAITEAHTFSVSVINQKIEVIKDLVDTLAQYFASDYPNKIHFWHGFTAQSVIDYPLKQKLAEALRCLKRESHLALEALTSDGLMGEQSFEVYSDLSEKISWFTEEDFTHAHLYGGFASETLQVQLEQALTIIQNYDDALNDYTNILAEVGQNEDLITTLASVYSIEILKAYRDNTLDDVNARCQQLHEVLRSWKCASTIFDDSIKNLTLTGNTDSLACYLAVATVVDVASAVDAQTLSLRSQALEDAADSPLLEEIFTKIDTLRQRKSILPEWIAFEKLPTLERLQEIREIFAQAGALKKLSGKWRKAFKEYSQFAKDITAQNKQGSIQQLDAIIEWQKDSQEFANDAALKTLLPTLFVGLETDTEALAKIRAFYRSIRERVLSLPVYGLVLAQQLKAMDKSVYEWLKQQQPVLRKGISTLSQLLKMTQLEERHDTPIALITANAAKEISTLEALSKQLTEIAIPRSIKLGLLLDALESRASYLHAQAACRNNLALKQLNFASREEKHAEHAQIISRLLSTARKVSSKLPESMHAKVLCQEGYGILCRMLECAAKVKAYQQRLHNLGVLLNKNAMVLEFWGVTPSNERQLLERVKTKLQLLEDNEHSFEQWCEVLNTYERVRQQDLAALIDYFSATTPAISFSAYVSLFRYLLYWNISQSLMQQIPVLGKFSRISYENNRTAFKSIDEELKPLHAKKLACEISRKNPPKGNSASRSPKEYTDMQLILHELSKQKRHIPIRQLVGNAYDALVAIKPCFMMGPLSVAQYLAPHNKKFDVVVMDEASQIKPEDALGVLARAKQVVVVGDSNQLPPTSFFDKLGGDTDDEEDITTIEDSESILDVYKPVFQPNRRLRWHYRSQHQSLISFSNHHFYDNDLVIFPSSTAHADTVGVKHVYVNDGVYSSQSNPIEATRLVQDIVGMIQQFPNRSYGIVTLNAKQKMVVEDEVERVRKGNPVFDDYLAQSENTDEPFFIKNLEGVQGDERDVIFVSTTFGPDENGVFRQNFGPINGANGWRRLNVLFTRAKQHVRIYSSFMPERIKIDDTKDQRGLRALRDYLQFAATGIDNHAYHTGNEPDSDFERSVGGFLKSQGYEIVYQLGVAGYKIDLVVKHPVHSGSYAIAIECDGATYHSAKSARDRDRLREENLRKLGWKYIHRIWSTDWFRQREKEEQRLLRAVEEAVANHHARDTAVVNLPLLQAV